MTGHVHRQHPLGLEPGLRRLQRQQRLHQHPGAGEQHERGGDLGDGERPQPAAGRAGDAQRRRSTARTRAWRRLDGNRGTKASSTAATSASADADPEQARVERQVERAHREARRIAREHGDHRLRDQHAEHRAAAAENQAFGEERAAQGAARRRRAPRGRRVRLRGGRVRARIRFATFEQAITNTRPDAASSTSSTVRARDVIWSRRRTASMRKSAFLRIRLGVFLDDGAVNGPQLGSRRLEVGARRETAEQLRHPVFAPGDHRRRQVVRAGHDVGDQFGFGRVGDRRLEDADDGRGPCAEPDDLADDRRIGTGVQSSRNGRSAPPRPRHPGHRPARRAAGRAPAAAPSRRSTSRRRLRRGRRAARRGRPS